MAGYGGYFLQGVSEGLQTGFNMGQQVQEMKWRKAQQKRLEDKELKITEGASLYSNLVKQLGEDGSYSDDDIMKLNTAFLSAGYEVQAVIKDSHNAIQTMNKGKLEQDLEWLDMFAGWTEGLDPKDVSGVFESVRGQLQTEKGKQIYEAYNNIYKKKYEAVQAQPTAEVFGSAGATREAYPEAGYEYSATAKGYVPTFQKPTTPEAPPTELDIMGETQKKLDYAYNTGNVNYFNQMAKSLGVDTTFDTYKQKYEKPGAAGAEKPRVTSLPQLEEYRDKALNADSWEDAQKIINDYTEAGYDATQLGVTKETWANNQKQYINNLLTVIKNITDEKGNLKKKKLTQEEVGLEFKGEQSASEIYKMIYASYIEYLEKLKNMGIDVNEFPTLKTIEEMNKGFWQKFLERGKYTTP